MRRREFITLLGGAAAASWPVAAGAQQSERMRRIGLLSTNTAPAKARLNAFTHGLADLGWIEGRNLAFEERGATNDPGRLPSLAAELVALRPDLIFVVNSASLAAARRATGMIPILFSTIIDPVGQGFVSSLAQPGGNITGFAGNEFEVATKTLELLKKIAPTITHVAFMYDPVQPAANGAFAQVQIAAASLAVELSKTAVRNAAEIEAAIDALALRPNVGLFLFPSPSLAANNELTAALAARHRLPAVNTVRYFVAGGGLASYGPDDVDLSRRAAVYADRILKGEKPADLPVLQPTKFELVINLKTAKKLGLTVSPDLLVAADEVIE